MFTKKCKLSFLILTLSLLINFSALHIMSFFSVSKWLGVGIGIGIFCISLTIFLIFNKKSQFVSIFVIFVCAIATGITTSSLFVMSGKFPQIWQTVVLYVIFITIFCFYCIFTNLQFVRKHYILTLISYSVLLFVISIILLILKKSPIFILSTVSLISFIGFLISLSVNAQNKFHHLKNLATCAFALLFIVIIVVLLVLSEGDGLDGVDLPGDISSNKKIKNPYDYYL